uniref:Tick transposon n=1 Tax=Rhipicephalus appendiculatus TaxID=34631 RepID=A0A131YKS8_RHIAP
MYTKYRSSSPACRRCGAEETLEHIICSCPALAGERCEMVRRYRLLGFPATTVEDFLFPARSRIAALRAFLKFAVPAELDAL